MRPHSDAPSDALREIYDRRAELQYPEPARLPDPALDRKFERVCELLAEQLPCRRFLDAGCGDGRYLGALASFAGRPEQVVGTDISDRILQVAGLTGAAAGLEVELVRANLESLPFPDGSFDLVLCTQVVEHLLDPARGLAEIARVLEPGGRALVTTDHRGNVVTKALNLPRTVAVRALGLRGRYVPVVWPERAFTVRGVCELLRETGLEPEHLETFRFSLRRPLDWPPAVRALNRLDRRLAGHRVGDLIAVVARKHG